MVLKKKKFSANTGNTLRKTPYAKLSVLKRAAFITKEVQVFDWSSTELNRKISFDDGALNGHRDLKYSLNKKGRWKLPNLLVRHITTRNALRTSDEHEKVTQIPDMTVEGSRQDPRIVLFEGLATEIGLRGTFCKRVIDSGCVEEPIKSFKTWKGNAQNILKGRDNIDVSYDLEIAPSFKGWPFHHESNFYLKEQRYSSKVMRCATKKRKKWIGEDIKDALFYFYNEADEEGDYDTLSSKETTELIVDEQVESVMYNKDSIHDLQVFIKERNPKKPRKLKKRSKKWERFLANEVNVAIKSNTCSSEELMEYPKGSVIYIENYDSQETDNFKSDAYDLPILTNPIEENLSTAKELKCQDFFVYTISSEVNKETLEANFGNAYIEGRSHPRKFAIFIGKFTSTSVISTGRQKNMNSIILFKIVHDECGIAQRQVKVELNVIDKNPTSAQLLRSTIQQISQDGVIASLKQFTEYFVFHYYNFVKPKSDRKRFITLSRPVEIITQRFSQWRPSVISTENLFNNVDLHHTVTKPNENYVQVSKDVFEAVPGCTDAVVVCPVCFDDVLLSQCSYLNDCCHVFCNNCWENYVCTQIRAGPLKIQCLQTKCENVVDITTVLTFASTDLSLMYVTKLVENVVLANDNFNWCPNCSMIGCCNVISNDVMSLNQTEDTGRIARQHPSTAMQDIPVVQCTCGKNWCFACQEESHWPTSCKAFAVAKAVISQEIGTLFDLNGKPYVVEVSVKKCPFCKRFINKGHGCNHMTCVCGRGFCWHCLQDFRQHNAEKCKENKPDVLEFSSLDGSKRVSNKRQVISAALKFQFQQELLQKQKTKLKVARWRDLSELTKNEETHHYIIMKACDILDASFIILKNIMLCRTEIKSRHLNNKILRFASRLEFAVSRLKEVLFGRKVEDLQFGEITLYTNLVIQNLDHLRHFKFLK